MSSPSPLPHAAPELLADIPAEAPPSSLPPSFPGGGLATPSSGAPLSEVTPSIIREHRKRPSYGFLALVSALSLCADLATKHWAEKALQTPPPMAIPTPKIVIKGVFGFMLAKNQGGAWGLLQSSAEHVRKPFFVAVSVLAILFIVSLYRRLHPSQTALRWGLPLVLGGALGNLVDRIRYGYVIDFIDVQAAWQNMQHHWPTFNVADIAICVGVGLMALDMLVTRRPEPPAVSSQCTTRP